MAIQEKAVTQDSTLQSLLAQVQKRGTPVRIDDASGSYYVLSAKQLMLLLQDGPSQLEPTVPIEADSGESFNLEDFGLTQAELVAYEQRRDQRRMMLNLTAQKPLSSELAVQIQQIAQQQDDTGELDEKKLEQALQELEASLLQNLNAIITVSE